MSAAIAYHQATKYDPQSIEQHPGLDWAAQPLPYREYHTSEPLELADFLPIDPNPFTGRPAGPRGTPAHEPLGLATISRWLYFTYGVTGVVAQKPRPLYLRAAPSAGGLYPAELYLLVRDALPGIGAGLYGYNPLRHQLAPLWQGDEAARALDAASYGNAAVRASPFALIVSAIFQRSAWRYGERAYRRVLLDSGHLLGNALLVAAELGLRTHLTAAFCDARLDALLRANEGEEGALAVVAANPPGPTERPSWSALPSGSGSGESGAGTLRGRLHAASKLGPERPRLVPRGEGQGDDLENRYAATAGQELALGGGRPLADALLPTILHRRSTRRYRRGPARSDQLARILASAYDSEALGLGTQPTLERSQLLTFVAIAEVAGLEPGVYYFAPHARRLRLLRAGLDRPAMRYLCLGQELGGDAFATVFHTADLPRAVAHLGDRAYRYLHLDAGILGQRLNLAALAEGLGASGIGGFFDDHVNALIGIPEEQAVVYMTTLGIPADAEE
jgi:SagB-type dehydrogenase family enzyme